MIPAAAAHDWEYLPMEMGRYERKCQTLMLMMLSSHPALARRLDHRYLF